jgi:Predicted nucleotide-binding protein containing TIR-like domain
MDKIKVFVGSSVGSLSHAYAIQKNLNYDAWVRVWNQGIFQAGSYPVLDLIAALDDADFGAFIFLPEDILILNRQNETSQTKVVRDNVLFELGMFVGRLGMDRVFMIKPRGKELHLPSDLLGVNAPDFNDDPNLEAALGSAAVDIRTRMQTIGPKGAPRGPQAPVTPGYDRDLALAKAKAAASSPALLRGRKYSRADVILPSGDVQSSERYEGMEAISDPVERVPGHFASRAGRITEPRFESLTEGQQVSWTWSAGKQDEERREGEAIFSPPLTKGHPVSYNRERYIINAISFTQRERLDVTNQVEREEAMRVTFRQLYDNYVFQLVFPDKRFPKRFRLEALSAGNKRDDDESAFAERQVTELPGTRTLLFNLPNPLPGYLYVINWELPEDAAEAQFNTIQAGFVEEMSRRLLALRTVTRSHMQAVRTALSLARSRITTPAGDLDDIEVTLFVYDRQKSWLACVASLNADNVEAHWQECGFKPGRGIVGHAFRQREVTPYPRQPTRDSAEPNRFEPLPGDDPDNPPTAVVALPLFYAGYRGRSVGILSLATRSNESPLLTLAKDAGRLEQISHVLDEWYGVELAEALGVIAAAKFWSA